MSSENARRLTIRTARLILAVAFLATVSRPSAAQVDCAQGANPLTPYDSLPDNCAIQALIDSGPLTVALIPEGQPGYNGYILANNLKLTRDNVVLTSTTPGQFVHIKAANDLRRRMIKMDDQDTFRPYELSWLKLDGNKSGRTNWYSSDCVAEGPNHEQHQKVRGITAQLKGPGLVRNNVFENAQCGSALEISGTGFNVYSNTFNDNGYQEGTFQHAWSEEFADAITIFTCINSNVTGNFINNATDVGIVVGIDDSYVNGCNVSNNQINNTTAYAFAGIVNGGSQARLNTTVDGNRVTASYNKLSFGIWLGEGPWGSKPATPNLGNVRYNSVTGAVVNLAIDNVSAGNVVGNVLYGAQGNKGMLGCTWPAEFTYGTIGSTTIQPGGIYRTWQGSCGPYVNPRPSAKVTSPSGGSQYYTAQSVTISVTASDPEGGPIDHVDFYANGSKLGTDYSYPYSYTANGPLPTGSFNLTAVAADSGGDGPTSNPSGISVATFVLTAPTNGATLAAGTYTTVTTSTNGPVAFVDYYAYQYGYGWFYAGTGYPSSSFALTLGPLVVGDYIIVGTANGDLNAQTPWHTVYVR